ncbi:cellulose biosynthesis cyclic di-GMP-binding regulatory protein BcsB [Psychrosphaera sp. F3M07]|uniref:cellulose biosynthesis cyclic di-GMP-binding regulatory protein BcsB n=1 Tax=Psychrosphaera sp. F3M07 TaxID=2841560 RepID=UPI001C0802CD|nr:cellulose biosynthesis cyclic di-GMP-binding regulatory protein BcsB [Psychrosphaera sp. F3M07]MBU2917513.1 cellulose biosynthesis cyclic di-GMP-binding regulatory protein BcsB [Psychrosphaera sp. F3M07]
MRLKHIFLMFFCGLLSFNVISSSIFVTTDTVELFSKKNENLIGNWPQDMLFTADVDDDRWLVVNGYFSSVEWVPISTPTYIKQSNEVQLTSDGKDLTLTEVEGFIKGLGTELDTSDSQDSLSIQQWLDKNYFANWAKSVHKRKMLLPHLTDNVNQQNAQLKEKINSTFRLSDLVNQQPLKLNGNKSSVDFSFGTRLDRVVEQATLNLEFIYSPTMVTGQSQVKIYLNDEVAGVITVDPKQAGKIVQKQIVLPSYRFREFNNVKFELLGYYETMNGQCFDPGHLGLWFELLSTSNIVLNEHQLPLQNDLSLLPVPFIDARQMSKQLATFIFPKTTDTEFVSAATKMAGWLGVQAEWRGNQFDVLFDKLPKSHAIVFATNDNKPYFLKDYPNINQPTVVMANHPLYKDYKLLLVLGKDAEQLKTAAEGVAIGHNNLSGQAAHISKIDYSKKLLPYQAPLWVNNERPMKFSEFVNDENELKRQGAYLAPIRVNMHIPADLFIWETRGVPVDLNYRYTPPAKPDISMLNVKINNSLVESFKLTEGDGIWEGGSRIRMPFAKELFSMNSELMLPSFQLGIQNLMEFDFIIKDDQRACLNEPSQKFVQIDSNSTLDFSGFEHYAEMPNMASLAYSGLPFTRMADLSETLVILPNKFSEEELELTLTMFARFSAITGYPATKAQISKSDLKVELNNKDIIYINSFTEESNSIDDGLNALIKRNSHRLALTQDLFKDSHQQERQFIDTKEDEVFVSFENENWGNIAIMSEFESPATSGRSVLSIMASRKSGLDLVSEVFQDQGKLYLLRGSTVIFHENKIVHNTVGEKYYTGELPIWAFTRYQLAQRPNLMLAIVLFSVFLVAMIAWRVLRFVSYKRVHGDH